MITRARALLVILPLLGFLTLAGWAYSSPVGSSPDDDYHLASIWCAAGERTSLCEETGDPSTRIVPRAFAVDPCFARFSTESGACQIGEYTDPEFVESDRGNFLGAYPPVFYGSMSVLATDDVQSSVLAMRLLNAALFVGIVVALAVLLPPVHRATAVTAFVITLVPLGMFLIPSVNPSSWTIIGVGTAWIALLGYFDSHGRRRWSLGVLFVIGAVMAAGARADAGVYVALGIAAVMLLRFARTREFAIASVLPVLVGALCIIAALGSGQIASAADGFGGVGSPPAVQGAAPTIPGGPGSGAAPVPQLSPLGLALTNAVNVPSLWAGALGFWSLGWFDTPLPAVVAFGGVGAFVAVAFAGLARVDWRKSAVFAGAAAALWFIPTWTLTRGGDQVGMEVQPRYLLPLIVMLAGFALLSVRDWSPRLSLAQRVVVGLTLAATQSLSLFVNLRRYVTGDDVRAVDLNDGIEWWWSGAPAPMLIWILASLAWAGLVAALVLLGDRRAVRVPQGVADPGSDRAVLAR